MQGLREVKAATLIEGVLRLSTFFLGLAPQLLGLTFFAFSVGGTLVVMSLIAIVSMALLTFMPHFRRSNLIGIVASIVLTAESVWELADSLRDKTDIAFSSMAGFVLGLAWFVWYVLTTVRGRAAENAKGKPL